MGAEFSAEIASCLGGSRNASSGTSSSSQQESDAVRAARMERELAELKARLESATPGRPPAPLTSSSSYKTPTHPTILAAKSLSERQNNIAILAVAASKTELVARKTSKQAILDASLLHGNLEVDDYALALCRQDSVLEDEAAETQQKRDAGALETKGSYVTPKKPTGAAALEEAAEP